MHKIIIIGGNHYNTLGLIRSIGEMGLPVYLFLEHQDNLSHCYLRFSKYIKEIYHLSDLSEILYLLKSHFMNESSKPIILCASDASISLLDKHYNEVKDYFFFFNAGEQGRINLFMNKTNLFDLASSSGLRVIKTWQLSGNAPIPEEIVYPCFSKPANSALYAKSGIGVSYSIKELEERLKDCNDLLVQEYISKDYEININGFSYNNGRDVQFDAVCRKIRDYPDRQGQYIVLEDISLHSYIDYDAIRNLVRAIGYEGLFSIEFLIKNNVSYFLEINMRNDGTNYLYTLGGYNYPFLWYLYCLGKLDTEHLNHKNLSKPLYLMQWSDISDVVHKRISVFQWVKDFSRVRAFYVLNIRDIKPFLFQLYQYCKIVLRKLKLFK